MKKVGIIGDGNTEVSVVSQGEPKPDDTHIQLENAQESVNPEDDYYALEFIDKHGATECAYLEVHNTNNIKGGSNLGVECYLTLGQFFYRKDPNVLFFG